MCVQVKFFPPPLSFPCGDVSTAMGSCRMPALPALATCLLILLANKLAHADTTETLDQWLHKHDSSHSQAIRFVQDNTLPLSKEAQVGVIKSVAKRKVAVCNE